MSAIDSYKHHLIGFINCPSSYNFVSGSETREIAVYELLEDIPENENSFDGKKGDILVGGGSGEAKALRISIPEIFQLKFDENFEFDELEQIYKHFWNPTFSYMIGDGFRKVGWNPYEIDLVSWLRDFVFEQVLLKESKYQHLNLQKT